MIRILILTEKRPEMQNTNVHKSCSDCKLRLIREDYLPCFLDTEKGKIEFKTVSAVLANWKRHVHSYVVCQCIRGRCQCLFSNSQLSSGPSWNLGNLGNIHALNLQKSYFKTKECKFCVITNTYFVLNCIQGTKISGKHFCPNYGANSFFILEHYSCSTYSVL